VRNLIETLREISELKHEDGRRWPDRKSYVLVWRSYTS